MLEHFTTYNVAAALCVAAFGCWLPRRAVDVVRGTSWMVASGVLAIHATFDPVAVMAFYHRMLQPSGLVGVLGSAAGLPWVSYSLDAVMHFLPALALGLPRAPGSVAASYLLVMAWYVTTRDRIPHVYMPEVPLESYDSIAFGALGPAALALGCVAAMRGKRQA